VRLSFSPLAWMITSVLKPKFAQEIRGLPTVIPAKAGIYKLLIFLDSGLR
jgi:hypothetical protein